MIGLCQSEMPRAVDPAGDDLQSLFLHLAGLFLVPVAPYNLPYLIPVVKQIRSEHNPEVFYAAIRIPCAVRERHNRLAGNHLVNQIILRAELTGWIEFKLHRAVALLRNKLLPLIQRHIKRLTGIVFITDAQDNLSFAVSCLLIAAAAADQHHSRSQHNAQKKAQKSLHSNSSLIPSTTSVISEDINLPSNLS